MVESVMFKKCQNIC